MVRDRWHLARPESLLFFFWAAMVLWLMSRHAIWADEARAWLIATRTPDWRSMFWQTHADGHPVLWYVILRAGSQIHDSVITLYAIQFVFAALATALCLSLKGLPLACRALLVVGGILGFEFAVIARNYAPAVAAMLAYACFYSGRERKPWLMGILLALALNVHAGMAPIVPFLLLPWALERSAGSKRPIAIAVALTGVGYLALLISIFPPYPDSIFVQQRPDDAANVWIDSLPAQQFIPAATAGLDDLSDMSLLIPQPVRIAMSIAIIFWVFFLFRSIPFRIAAVGIVIATSAFYGITYPIVSYRHSAFLILALICLMQMEFCDDRRSHKNSVAYKFLLALLVVQILRLVFVVAIPFSSSKAVAAALSKTEFRHARVFCIPDWMGQTIAAQRFADCTMALSGRTGPYPLFLFRDFARTDIQLSEIIRWMNENETKDRPALVYMNQRFVTEILTRPDFARVGQRFVLTATPEEKDVFRKQVEFLTEPRTTMSPENGVLLRLKPEYRVAPFPSVAPHTDP